MRNSFLGFALAAIAIPQCILAQKPFEAITGKPFDSAVPKDFYLEGNAIPTAKRNAILVHTAGGQRAIFSLIDTTGYSSDIQAKYVGMIITEGDVSLCGKKVGVGSYGFGWQRPATGVDKPGAFSLYDQAGTEVAKCATPRDGAMARPVPLQMVSGKDGVRLYAGRHYLDLR
jgi:hypothetical protein